MSNELVWMQDFIDYLILVGEKVIEEISAGTRKPMKWYKEALDPDKAAEFCGRVKKPADLRGFTSLEWSNEKSGKVIKSGSPYDAVDIYLAQVMGGVSPIDEPKLLVGALWVLGVEYDEWREFVGKVKWLVSSVTNISKIRYFLVQELTDPKWFIEQRERRNGVVPDEVDGKGTVKKE